MNNVGCNAAYPPSNCDIGEGDGRYERGELNGRSLTPHTPQCTSIKLDDEQQKSRSLAQRECDHHGEKSLLLADRQCHTDYMQMLNEAGKDISNVVTTAFRGGGTELLNLLKCLKTKRPSQTTLDNALCEAAKQGQIKCLDILKAAGAKDLDGALYAAVRANSIEAQNALLCKGANDYSLIHSAVREDNLECLDGQIISDHINATNEEGCTALHIAILNGYIKSLEKLLKTKGVDINIADKTGWTPLHCAVTYGTAEKNPDKRKIADAVRPLLVKSLLDVKGIKVNKINYKNNEAAALHLAVKFADTNTVKVLLDATDIDVNAKNRKGYTPLHLAVKRGCIDVIESLLKFKGIQVNEKIPSPKDYHSRGITIELNKTETPLHIAVKERRTEIVEILLGFEGIDVDVKNHLGKTARSYANKEIKQLFQNLSKRK